MSPLKAAPWIFWMLLLQSGDTDASQTANDLFTMVDRCNAQYDKTTGSGDGCIGVIYCLEREIEEQYAALSSTENLRKKEFKRLVHDYDRTYSKFFLEIMNGHKWCDCGSIVGYLIMREQIPDLHRMIAPLIEMRQD
ncbi:MAG: hypothetical protein HQL51_10880 [Magnetococcales bacterium]|nr:hypothetical protein [Magnetococcales bacterium]